MKIKVTSACQVGLPGQPLKAFEAGQIVEASPELAREFFIHGRAVKIGEEEINVAPPAPVREAAALASPGENAARAPAKKRRAAAK